MKSVEVVQGAVQMLEEHGWRVNKELKSKLCYSSTLCQVYTQHTAVIGNVVCKLIHTLQY